MQHAFNAVLMVAELFLNSIPLERYKFGYVELWCMAYGCLSVLHRMLARNWIYPVCPFDSVQLSC